MILDLLIGRRQENSAAMADRSTSGSILESARRLGTTVLNTAETRLALFSTALQQGAHRFVWLILWGVIGVFLFGLGVLLVALLIVVFFWDSHRTAALGIGGGFFLMASFSIAAIIVRLARQHRNPFAVTLGELAKDRNRLEATP